MFYISVIYRQISKGCSIEFLSTRTILAISIKENFRCARLMRRSFIVEYDNSSCFVCYSPSTNPQSRLITIEFQLLVHVFNFLRGRNDRLWMNLLCWYMFIINAIRPCNERTTYTVFCFIYITFLVKKGLKRGRK